uniref:Response regulatory domain-containing protein n=1 Tax=Leersia perrieri TaxID=77586 RepID=A0A0D9WG75_9ORYZ
MDEMCVLCLAVFSEDEDVRTVMRAVLDGACDYIVKPLTSDVTRRIWMHVLRWRLGALRPQASSPSPSIDRQPAATAPPLALTWNRRDGGQDAELAPQPLPVPEGNMVGVVAGSSRGENSQQAAAKAALKKKGAMEVSDEGSNNFEPTQERKKARDRFIWTTDAHSAFVRAYNHLKDEAGPKRIKQLMELEGIFVTKSQVSSHLQKYRGWLETRNNHQVGRSPYVLLNNYNINDVISHCHLKRNSILTEGPLTGMFSRRPVHSIATSNGRPATSQSHYEGVGHKEIDNFISNHQTYQGTAISHGSVIRHASFRSEVTSAGHDGIAQASTSAMRQPTQTSQNCAANLRAINDPKPITQEMSDPQIAPASLGYSNDVMSDWTEISRLDDLLDNDVLMNNLFDGDQLQQDVVTALDETQEVTAFHINNDFRSVQSEGLNNDFPNYEITNGMNGASGGDLTEGMLNDPTLQGDDYDILNYLE